MDEIDLKIIELLRENARENFVNIARHLRVSEGTIRNRVQRLLRDGVIKRFTVETKHVGVEGIVLIKTKTDRTKSVLKRIKGAEKVYELSGDYDLAVFLRASSTAELNMKVDAIRALPGVVETYTMVRLGG